MPSPEEIYAVEKYYLANKDYSGYQKYIQSVSKADYQRYTSKRSVLVEADRSGGQKFGDAVGTLLLGVPVAGGGRLAAQAGTRAIGRGAPKEVLEYVAARKAGKTIKATPAVTEWLTKNYGGVLSGMGGINKALTKTTTEKVGERAGRLLGRIVPASRKGKLAAGAGGTLAAGIGINALRGGGTKGGGVETVNEEDAMRLAQEQFTGEPVPELYRRGTKLAELVQKYKDLGFDDETALEAAQEDLLDQISAGRDGSSGVGFAQIAEQRRQFDIQNEREQAEFNRKFSQEENQFVTDQMRGMEEFEKNYALDLEKFGLTKEQIADARNQFAQSFAENQRQFNLQEGRLTKQAELEGELGRGQLAETQRANKAREAEIARQRALEEQKNIQDILRNPSDFLARAFESRGARSPYATVSQADLINQLKASTQNASLYAKGGTTQEGKFVTGEEGAEIILNPTNAPIAVLNHKQTMQTAKGKLSGYAHGTFSNDSGTDTSTYDDFNQGVSLFGQRRPKPTSTPTPETYDFTEEEYGTWSRAVDQARAGSLDPAFIKNIGDQVFYSLLSSGKIGDPSWGYGGGRFNIGAGTGAQPQVQAALTQEEIIRQAKEGAPPAVRTAVEGGRIPSARPYGQLTPGRLQRLTNPELQALNTYLAAVGNTNLETEMGLLQQRFGPVVSRSRGRLQV